MPESELRRKISTFALDLSRMRKAEKLLEHSYLDECVRSSPEETEADWRHALIFWIDQLMTRSLALGDLESACYWHFEGIWIDQIKQHRAYHFWIYGRNDGSYWTPGDQREDHYFQACEELRDLFVNPGCKESIQSFSEPRLYLQRNYLAQDGTATGPQIAQLIELKAQRLVNKLGWTAARQCAARFVAGFYGNIVPAVVGTDRQATIRLLQSLEHSGSPANAPDIVNGFETLLAIRYLDLKLIEDLWDAGEVRREVIF
jgi:hypothetical protein